MVLCFCNSGICGVHDFFGFNESRNLTLLFTACSRPSSLGPQLNLTKQSVTVNKDNLNLNRNAMSCLQFFSYNNIMCGFPEYANMVKPTCFPC